MTPRLGTAVAIGNFDGIHLGHQKIIEMTQQLASQYQYTPVMLTFDPYPQQYFHPEKPVPRLTTLREKVDIIRRFDCFVPQEDVTFAMMPGTLSELLVYALPFDQALAQYSPEYFIQEILIKKLKAKMIIVGEDFRFGYQRKGDVKLLQSISEFKTQIISPVMLEGERISSTRVRHSLREGNLELAQKLLGRYYSMTGRIVRGNQRGRQLGFPTANIAMNKRIPPIRGVFAVKVSIDDKSYSAVANIGSRPTVDGMHEFLEVYIFDFGQDIYGKYINIEFIQKIRDEMKFNSLDELKQQIAKDAVAAKEVLCI